MFWNKYFWPSFLILVLVSILHWVASSEGYYWTVEWYDFMMHFLGGVWVALFSLWISGMRYGHLIKPFVKGWNLVFVTIIVGIAWELFEVALGFNDTTMQGYFGDTTQDLIMDVLGVAFVILMYKKRRS